MNLGEILTAIEEGETILTEIVADETELASGATVALPVLVPTIGGTKYDVAITVKKA